VAHSLSAKKRVRQNARRRMRNQQRKTQLKTQVGKFLTAVRERDLPAAEQLLQVAYKKLDQIAAKGTIHKNAAARKKARLAHRLNALKASRA